MQTLFSKVLRLDQNLVVHLKSIKLSNSSTLPYKTATQKKSRSAEKPDTFTNETLLFLVNIKIVSIFRRKNFSYVSF